MTRSHVAPEDGLVAEALTAAGLDAEERFEAFVDSAGVDCQVAFLSETLAAIIPTTHPRLTLFDGRLVLVTDVEMKVALSFGYIAAAFADWRVREGDVATKFGVCGKAEHTLGTEALGRWPLQDWSLDDWKAGLREVEEEGCVLSALISDPAVEINSMR